MQERGNEGWTYQTKCLSARESLGRKHVALEQEDNRTWIGLTSSEEITPFLELQMERTYLLSAAIWEPTDSWYAKCVRVASVPPNKAL